MAAVALVFVYGTLMRRHANHRVLVRLGARFADRARTEAPRTLVDLGPYPALLPVDARRDRTTVEGELFHVAPAALPELDAFEGCPRLYRRTSVTVVTERGDRREAYTYELARRPPASARPVEGGRYEGGGRALETSAEEIDAAAGPVADPGDVTS